MYSICFGVFSLPDHFSTRIMLQPHVSWFVGLSSVVLSLHSLLFHRLYMQLAVDCNIPLSRCRTSEHLQATFITLYKWILLPIHSTIIVQWISSTKHYFWRQRHNLTIHRVHLLHQQTSLPQHFAFFPPLNRKQCLSFSHLQSWTFAEISFSVFRLVV